MIKKLKLKLLTKSFVISIAAFFAVAAIASAVTTISANIETGGTITAGGNIILQNGETISNATDGTITFGSTLIKGTGTGSLINLGGALKVSGTTASDNALATIGSLVTDAGVDVSANTGRLTGLQINLASSGSTVTGFRGIDSRVTDTGTAANVVGLQAFAKKTAGVSAAELWGTNSIAQLTGGAVLNAYGVVGDLTIGTGATITDVQLNSFATAGFFQSFIHTDAVLAKAIDSAVTAVISSDTGRGKSAKGTFGVTSVLNGALSQSTEGASAAYKVMDFNTDANFDYGLDLFYSDSPYSNVFGTADIRLQNGETISNATDGTIAFGAANLTNTGNITVTSGYVNAPAYQVGSGSAFSDAANSPTKATLQQASYWGVITSGNVVDIDLPAMDAVDIGRHLLFVVTAGGTNALTVTSGVMTVATVAQTGTGTEDVGDTVDCLIVTTTKAWCDAYAAD